MRILALSDIRYWEWYDEAVKQFAPDLIIMAGDVTDDGRIDWRRIVRDSPEIQRQFSDFISRHGKRDVYKSIEDCWPGMYEYYCERPFFDAWRDFAENVKATNLYRRLKQEQFDVAFRAFLISSTRMAPVFVLRGDHDVAPLYDENDIESVANCYEISDKVYRIDKLTIMGLSLEKGDCKKDIMNTWRRLGSPSVDILVAHNRAQMARHLPQIDPKLIVRGHFGFGTFVINGIPTVYTDGVHSAILDVKYGKVRSMNLLDSFNTKRQKWRFERGARWKGGRDQYHKAGQNWIVRFKVAASTVKRMGSFSYRNKGIKGLPIPHAVRVA